MSKQSRFTVSLAPGEINHQDDSLTQNIEKGITPLFESKPMIYSPPMTANNLEPKSYNIGQKHDPKIITSPWIEDPEEREQLKQDSRDASAEKHPSVNLLQFAKMSKVQL